MGAGGAARLAAAAKGSKLGCKSAGEGRQSGICGRGTAVQGGGMRSWRQWSANPRKRRCGALAKHLGQANHLKTAEGLPAEPITRTNTLLGFSSAQTVLVVVFSRSAAAGTAPGRHKAPFGSLQAPSSPPGLLRDAHGMQTTTGQAGGVSETCRQRRATGGAAAASGSRLAAASPLPVLLLFFARVLPASSRCSVLVCPWHAQPSPQVLALPPSLAAGRQRQQHAVGCHARERGGLLSGAAGGAARPDCGLQRHQGGAYAERGAGGEPAPAAGGVAGGDGQRAQRRLPVPAGPRHAAAPAAAGWRGTGTAGRRGAAGGRAAAGRRRAPAVGTKQRSGAHLRADGCAQGRRLPAACAAGAPAGAGGPAGGAWACPAEVCMQRCWVVRCVSCSSFPPADRRWSIRRSSPPPPPARPYISNRAASCGPTSCATMCPASSRTSTAGSCTGRPICARKRYRRPRRRPRRWWRTAAAPPAPAEMAAAAMALQRAGAARARRRRRLPTLRRQGSGTGGL